MTNLIGQSLGRYHILEQLGEGGMATVYKAYDTRLERNVAIKIIRRNAFPPEQLERILQRFEREAKALAKLSHPNIVGVIDYEEYEGSPYLVLVYLPGGTLKSRMGNAMFWKDAIRLLIPIANALDYAHQHKVIHRDVKPANILLTENGHPMLTDFGIAKILEIEDGHTLTGTGVGVGTPEYMSPEQGMGRDVDGRTDIYSMGIILFELVTGRKPYTADTPMAVVVKHMTDPLPRPSQYIKTLPEFVERVLIKALAKDPKDRYINAGVFAQVLENLVDSAGQPGANSTLELTGGRREEFETMDAIESAPALQKEKKLQDAKPVLNKNFWPGLGVAALIVAAGLTGWMLLAGEVPLKEIPTHTQIPPSMTSEILITEPENSAIKGNDGMILVNVPAGEFEMGSSVTGLDYEKPVHTVYLDEFWIDQTEITNAMYKLCVQAGKCVQPVENDYFGNPSYAQHPVVNINWNDAFAYCDWAGRSLPTEAQWEKSARGTDGRYYPWGDQLPDNELLNLNNGSLSKTVAVGSYPKGVSPYGVFDMAGNVWEWVADWFDGNYYKDLADLNPEGPASGQYRVIRDTRVSIPSGSQGYEVYGSAIRSKGVQSFTSQFLGFRCAIGNNR